MPRRCTRDCGHGCVAPQPCIERGAMSMTLACTKPDECGRGRVTRASRPVVVAGLLAIVAMVVGTGPQAMLPAAKAAPGQHTVVYRILGGGDVYSVIPDPGTPVYPSSTTTWVSTPWSQTVQVTGNPYLALNYTDKDGGPHDCAI